MEENIFEKPVLEVKDIAKWLQIGKRQAYDLVASNVFHSVRVGKKIKVSRSVFEEWLNGKND